MDQQPTMDQQLPPFFFDIFDPSLPRLGPGDEAHTLRALDTLFAAAPGRDRRDPALRILDVGCGNGAQTLALARHTRGPITAVDNHQPFLDELVRRAEAAGVAERIRPLRRDMRDMGFPPASFDLIWSEGALFVMGFGAGLRALHGLLAPGGMLAASELAWFGPDAPAECREYFAATYPAMTGIEQNLKMVREAGLEPLSHFVQPEGAWRENFYLPLAARLEVLRDQPRTPDELALIEAMEREIDIFRRYLAYFGNVFFLMRKI